jgi:hypothetical protein
MRSDFDPSCSRKLDPILKDPILKLDPIRRKLLEPILADDSCSAAACAAAGATIAVLVLLKNPISCSARKGPPTDTNQTLRLPLTAAGSFLPSVLPPPRPTPRLLQPNCCFSSTYLQKTPTGLVGAQLRRASSSSSLWNSTFRSKSFSTGGSSLVPRLVIITTSRGHAKIRVLLNNNNNKNNSNFFS